MNIFLVEDDDLDAELFERGVRKAGAAVNLTRARDGREALDMLSTEGADAPPHPCVILLDINMPRMTGHEFLTALRADSGLRGCRVFVFTTSSNQTDIDRAYRNCANGYIVKPNGIAELKEVLHMLDRYWQICSHPTDGLPN